MARARQSKKEQRVEKGNSVDLASYKDQFMSEENFKFKIREQDSVFHIDLESAASLSEKDLQACFDLVELTSSHDYTASSMGWHPKKKLKEMRLPDLRYLLVRTSAKDSSTSVPLGGFASFMLTYDDAKEVIYVYEIHLAAEVRGSGLGRHLMLMIEETGKKAGMAASMLTVFESNRKALDFYKRLEYDLDASSPGPRELRNGVVKMPDYMILSKRL